LNLELLKAGRPNLDEDRWLLWSVALFPVVFVAVSLGVKIFTPGLYRGSIREDGLIEWGTALVFGAAGGFAVLLASSLWQQRRRVLGGLYLGLAAGMALAMLEEISWGQRVLNIESPEFFRENSVKDEVNLHNLEGFPLQLAFLIVGFYGAFSRLLTPGSVRRRFPVEVDLLTPRYALSGYFLLTFLLYVYFEYVYRTIIRPLGITDRRSYDYTVHFIDAKEQEPLELLLAMGFLIFVLDNWQRYSRARRRAAADVGHAPGRLRATSSSA
jgi:hypothetical protein